MELVGDQVKILVLVNSIFIKPFFVENLSFFCFVFNSY